MRAACFTEAGKPMEVREVPDPTPGPGEIVLRVRGCGICGSDLHVTELPGAVPSGAVMGHEFAGTVVEAGSRDGERLVGTCVAVLCFRTCGECRLCASGRPHLCARTQHIGHGAGWGKRDYYPGAMAEYCIAWPEYCYPLPDHVPSEDAALLDAVGVAVHATGLVLWRRNEGTSTKPVVQCRFTRSAARYRGW